MRYNSLLLSVTILYELSYCHLSPTVLSRGQNHPKLGASTLFHFPSMVKVGFHRYGTAVAYGIWCAAYGYGIRLCDSMYAQKLSGFCLFVARRHIYIYISFCIWYLLRNLGATLGKCVSVTYVSLWERILK